MKLMKKLPFKKRYLLGGYIAFELAALTAAGTAGAQIVDHIKFQIPQKVASATLPTVPGFSRLVISSNAPFSISASEAIGEYDVKIVPQGHINATPYGLNAQMPGPETSCGVAVSPSPSVIYAATKKTATTRGDVLSQSVMVEIRYDETMRPRFEVKTEQNSAAITTAAPCESKMG